LFYFIIFAVVWKSAVESLDHANKFIESSQDARFFVEKYMVPIIGILVEQQPAKIGHHERNCVQDSLAFAVVIIAKDLEIQIQRGGESVLLVALSHIFNKKKAFYKGKQGTWNVNHLQGLPEVRLKMIERFRAAKGFGLLNMYLTRKIGTPLFPPLESLHHILQAVGDAIPTVVPGVDQGAALKDMEDDAILVANAFMTFITSLSDEALKKLPTDALSQTQKELQRIFDRLVATRRSATYDFYQFWRALVLRLITSNSLPLKLFGWEQVGGMIEASAEHRPPPRAFIVTNAGCPFVNGPYIYAGDVTPDNYARIGGDTTYVRKVPEGEDGVGKKLTLFRCTMRSQQKWWFLSEADEEQPGTDRDIDYYQHKSKEHEEAFPPPAGWITCRNAGVEPPPNLASQGLLVPDGEEYNSLEHQLAKWATENEIVEQVLGDTTIHREVVARSTVLIKFLASMCHRVEPSEMMTDGVEPKKYCLQTSHLLYAWKTCTRKADAAVSSQVYQLLVSILPLCPSDLAIPLLKAIQTSLLEGQGTRDYLFEVAEFCSALAAANLVDSKSSVHAQLSDEVREEVLNLLWSILTHPDASSLKSHDVLKRYVTHELRVEPRGSEHREKFLKSCIDAMSTYAAQKGDSTVNEVQALRMVKLTHFLLEACPRQQADKIVMEGGGALPVLLFNELTSYLERRKNGIKPDGFRKTLSISQSQTTSVESDSKQHSVALNERLRILRNVYGLSDPAAGAGDPIVLSLSMLQNLWLLCDDPEDREAIMVFVASASHNGKVVRPDHSSSVPATVGPVAQSDHGMSAAFSTEVCQAVFLELFCSQAFSYEHLGDRAYRSFQFLFNALNLSKTTATDALWRICLTACSDSVASLAMRDLLAVYAGVEKTKGTMEQMVTDDSDESFGERIFQYLGRIKTDLDAKARGAERSAERCLRILNQAIGQTDRDGYSMTPSTLTRLAGLPPTATLEEAVKCLPHGMRGQGCYRRIGIVTKRPQVQNHSQGPQAYQGNGNGAPAVGAKPPSTIKSSLDVHPLETLASLKNKVAANCNCTITAVKPIQINGRAAGTGGRSGATDPAHMNLNLVPEDSVMDELGIVQGCEVVFVIAERPQQVSTVAPPATTSRVSHLHDMSGVFFSDNSKFGDKLFDKLLGILELLPWPESDDMIDGEVVDAAVTDTHKLIWDLLLAMPSNINIASQVKSAEGAHRDAPSTINDDDAMEVESVAANWAQILDIASFSRSVYVLLTIDAFLQPAPECLSILPAEERLAMEKKIVDDASSFRRAFIESGGFNAVVNFFSACGGDDLHQGKTRRGNAVALRILKSCLFGNIQGSYEANDIGSPDEAGSQLLQSLSDAEGLLKSLVAMVVDDSGISSSTITDVLRFLRLLFQSDLAAQSFVSLPDKLAERFLFIVLIWNESLDSARTSSSEMASLNVRRSVHDLILQTPLLADSALPWLIKGIDKFEVDFDGSSEYFDVVEKLLATESTISQSRKATDIELHDLGNAICAKLAACPRPSSEADLPDYSSTAVLCGCLKILRALVENGGGNTLRLGTEALLTELGITRWSEMVGTSSKGVLALMSSQFRSQTRSEDIVLIDLMGVIFDGFLSPGGSSSVAICCDKESRGRGFDVVGAAARFCKGGEGYTALVSRVEGLMTSAAPHLRHRWGLVGANAESHSSRNARGPSKYSGLRNQGCTCYMNSFLQQLFMMPELRDSMCAAPLPTSLRSSGGGVPSKGHDLVGKNISLQWENGVSYDAVVEAFDERIGMHTLRYCTIQVATVGGAGHNQVQPEDIAKLPPSLPDEFVLSDGRPGKETGVFDIIPEPSEMEGVSTVVDPKKANPANESDIQETEDESTSRHLLEEVQRTFIHLEEGSKRHCFDPRVLVEACHCLKLEFDVWQQNDASEFATKLLDRLEISLKRWAPSHFKYMDHTFGLKQTKQKICKECGLKTNREEKLMNIDCQIRGKSDIHEALSAMTEVEIMEGSNKVFCETCKKNTDTVLRTAISTLPNMLILSLKRFDLDYNTFETIKLNSRCAFGQTLDMKPYTLEGLEEKEKSGEDEKMADPASMDAEVPSVDGSDTRSSLPDEDYEYRLAGVLVHAGVAQGGHYYSFIKDRNGTSEEKWYRFDDEDVTPFDPASIETECFGGKVKKETKWPNGQVHAVEQEQFANALMLFYEKVKTSDPPLDEEEKNEIPTKAVVTTSGYDIFEPDVRRSNAMHRWQAFLFDAEFQTFMKGMLGVCRLSCRQPDLASRNADNSWRAPVMQMLLTFVFDIMFYSVDHSLNEWTQMLEETLLLDHVSAREFVHKLARKTQTVSSNWLRTFLLECTDQSVRSASVRIFSSASKSCVSSKGELLALNEWSKAWKDYFADVLKKDVLANAPISVPCTLGGSWLANENVEKLDGGVASSLGVIISHINVLLEALPRSWRYSAEVCLFIRFLATMPYENRESAFREPMIAAMIPPRLIALAIRERAPSILRGSFPGVSLAPEVANSQMRAESNTTAHVMPMSGNQLNASELNNARGPVAADYLILLEVLGCLAGLPGVNYVPLVRDDEHSRGRQRFVLTEPAIKALSVVFHESCAPGAPGMGQREIEAYLHRRGVDTGSVSTQKIADMLSKYPTTTGGNGSAAGTFLSLEGFLAYYRDTAQTNDMRVRHDLHSFGFRPDLTRRSRSSRYFFIGDRESQRLPAESVAVDVAEHFGDRSADLGTLGNMGLGYGFHIFALAHNVCEPLAEYLVAAATYRKGTAILITRTLQMIFGNPNDWGGNEAVSAATMVLTVIASTPGDDQDLRIANIMQSTEKASRNVAYGAGLLQVARSFHRARQTQHYNNEFHWCFERYITVLKELRHIYPIFKWMQDNHNEWSFMERELLDSHSVATQENQVRGDYAPRDTGNAIPLDHHTHSDSDMAGMNDSEDDDEDSQFDAVNTFGNTENDGPFQIVVEGAGNPAVNGVYNQDGYFERACRYVKEGTWNKKTRKFYILQCHVSNNTKHWYISIVPNGGSAGTSSDIDFYTAPLSDEEGHIPPGKEWTISTEGRNPPPTLLFRPKNVDVTESPEMPFTDIVQEDENQDGSSPYI
jgi:ubiquitin carboxyl-terminal hydrolase 9/24